MPILITHDEVTREKSPPGACKRSWSFALLLGSRGTAPPIGEWGSCESKHVFDQGKRDFASEIKANPSVEPPGLLAPHRQSALQKTREKH